MSDLMEIQTNKDDLPVTIKNEPGADVVEDLKFFPTVDTDKTLRCLENTRLVIKDFETQLDWHLQQYMTLRNIVNPRRKVARDNSDPDARRQQELISISQLSTIITSHAEGNKNFIKRKPRPHNEDEETEEDTDFSEDNSDNTLTSNSNTYSVKDVVPTPSVLPKEEFDEEVHELVVPKEEKLSDDDDVPLDQRTIKKSPRNRGRKATLKGTSPGKSPKTKPVDRIDLTNMKKCAVVLNRIDQIMVQPKEEPESMDYDSSQ